MPIYEYRCLDCNNEFELMQKFSDPPLEHCPSCAGRVDKLISRSAFHLKGSGWYVTDYARKGSQNGKNSSSTGSDTDTSSSSTSTTSTDKETPSKETATKETTKSSAEAA